MPAVMAELQNTMKEIQKKRENNNNNRHSNNNNSTNNNNPMEQLQGHLGMMCQMMVIQQLSNMQANQQQLSAPAVQQPTMPSIFPAPVPIDEPAAHPIAVSHIAAPPVAAPPVAYAPVHGVSNIVANARDNPLRRVNNNTINNQTGLQAFLANMLTKFDKKN